MRDRGINIARQRQVITEKEVTKAIRDTLRACGVFHWKVWQGLGSAPGVADILGVYRDGRIIAIEVKRPGARVKPGSAQERFLRNVYDLGGIAIEADSVDALIDGFRRCNAELPVLGRR